MGACACVERLVMNAAESCSWRDVTWAAVPLSVQYVEIIGQDWPLNAIDRYNKFISAAATGNLTLR